MAQTYFLIPTADGEAKLANAQALGIPLKLTAMAVGDGNGVLPVPSRDRKTLVNERRRAPLNSLTQDPDNPSQIIAEQVIPEDVGGWWIREAGLYDDTGTLIYYTNVPETYKPQLAEGSGRTQVVRLVCLVTSGATVELKVDPSIVLATRSYVDTQIAVELDKRDAKQSVYVATTGPLAALSGLQTIDGQPLTAGARVLVKNQAAAKDNGVYIAAAGAWTRASDFDSGLDVTPGVTIPVEQGATQYTSVWHLTTQGAIIIGATPLTFKRVGDGYFAPLESPDFTGTPKVDTAPPGTATRQAASTAFVAAAIAALINAAPAQLDTINELAAALGNDANFAATITAGLASKAALAGAAFTGAVTLPAPAAFANDQGAVTSKWVNDRGLAMGGTANVSVNASRAVTANDAGKVLINNGNTVISFGKPNALGISNNAVITVVNYGANTCSLAFTGGTSYVYGAANQTASFPLLAGESVMLEATGDTWLVIGGTAAMSKIGSFAALLAVPGYFRLPSGIIVQWGVLGLAAATGGVAATTDGLFPVAFPGAVATFVTSANNSTMALNSNAFVAGSALSNAVFRIQSNYTPSNITANWVAIGY